MMEQQHQHKQQQLTTSKLVVCKQSTDRHIRACSASERKKFKCRNFNDLYAHTPALRRPPFAIRRCAAVNKINIKQQQQPNQGVRVRSYEI